MSVVTTIKPTKIFPWSRSSQINDKLFYEQNVSNLIRQIVDNNFVISGNIKNSQVSNDEPFRVNIYGYYIEIPSQTSIPIQDNVYLKINLSGNEVVEINQDSEDPVAILTNVDMESVTDPHLYIKIWDKETQMIPHSSRIKFNPISLDLLEIDGQHEITGHS